MPQVIVGFSTTKKDKIVASIIKAVEKTPFSHVYIKIWSEKLKRNMIYHASGSSVNFMGCQNFNEKHQVIKEFPLNISEEGYTKLLQTCIDLSGLSYGVKQLLGLGLVRLLRFFGFTIKNPCKDGKKTYICSELVGQFLVESFGYSIQDLEDISPKMIYEMLEQNGKISSK